MSEVITGTIESMRRDRKGLKISGNWVSGFNELPQGFGQGDFVDVTFKRKGQYMNFVSIKHAGAAAPAHTVGQANGGYGKPPTQQQVVDPDALPSRKQFPMHHKDPERGITRRHALSAAWSMIEAKDSKKGVDIMDVAVMKKLAQVVRHIELYSMGVTDVLFSEAFDMIGEGDDVVNNPLEG